MGKNETNVAEVIEEVKEEVTEVVNEEAKVEEKKGFFYGVGQFAGKVANGAAKVVKSKPAKVIAAIGIAAGAAKLGYEQGKKHSDSVLKDADVIYAEFGGNNSDNSDTPSSEN